MMKIGKFTDFYRDVTKEGTKIPQEKYLQSGRYPVIDQGRQAVAGRWDSNDGIFEKVPAIIFGDHTRAIKYIEEPFFIGADGVKILRPVNSQDNPKYLYYALQSARIPDLGYSRHFKAVKELEIRVYSTEEQNEIVRILEKIDHLIEQRHTEIGCLDQLVKSRFVELFGDAKLNPKGYPVKALSEIAEYWNGLTYKPEDVADSGTIVLRSSNIQNAQLDFEDIVRVNCKIGDKKFVQKNDILMCSRNGSARLVGKVALIQGLDEPMSFGAFMMIIRSQYYPFLLTFFQTSAFREQIATGATTTINQITGNMLNKVVLPVPDIETMNEFAAFCKQTDKSKLAVQKGLQELEILKKSLMQQYFG